MPSYQSSGIVRSPFNDLDNDAQSSKQQLETMSFTDTPSVASTAEPISDPALSLTNRSAQIVTNINHTEAPVAVIYDGEHFVEQLTPSTIFSSTTFDAAPEARFDEDLDGEGLNGAGDDNTHLEESDGDVLERGIVVTSPAFTYVYEDATSAVCGAPPPLSLDERESVVAPSNMFGIDAQGDALSMGIALAMPSTSLAEAPLHLQYLGPAASVDALDHAVMFNIRGGEVDYETTPSDEDNQIEPHASYTTSLLEASKRGLSLQDPQTDSPAGRARLVVKKPLLSGDDDHEVSSTNFSADGNSVANLPLASGASSGTFGTFSGHEFGNLTTLQLDENGKLVRPTEPVQALSLAFRTLHPRQSSLKSSRRIDSSTGLEPICELTPMLGEPFDASDSNSRCSNGTGAADSCVSAKTDQDLGDIESTRSQQKLLPHLPFKRKYHPSKHAQPQEGDLDDDRDFSADSRRDIVASRLLQEAAQYAEALGERPPRNVHEISQRIIDDDYDQFASDEEDEPLSGDNSVQLREQNMQNEGLVGFDLNEQILGLEQISSSKSTGENMYLSANPEPEMIEELQAAEYGSHDLGILNRSIANSFEEVLEEKADFSHELCKRVEELSQSLVFTTETCDNSGIMEETPNEDIESPSSLLDQPSASPPQLPLPHDNEEMGLRSRTASVESVDLPVPETPLGRSSERTGDSVNYHTTYNTPGQPPFYTVLGSHRANHSSLIGKYMLNPRPAGSDENSSGDGGYVYQGLKYNPPEVTRRGTQRGNHAQLHRKAWLEVSDKYHRYGKNLRLYYKEWERLGHPYEMFFDWLDSKGEAAGQPLPNLPECPRTQLDADTVLYITDPDVQESYRLTLGVACKGELPGEVPDRRGVVLDCNDEPVSTGPDGWIFVLRDNNFYGARKVTEVVASTTSSSATSSRSLLQRHNSNNGGRIKKRFHHSSFFAGKAVTAAGIFITDEAGHIKCMYPHSGHYRPGEAHMQRLLYFVQRMGIDLSSFEVDVQQIAHVARKEKVVLQYAPITKSPSGDGDDAIRQSEADEDDEKLTRSGKSVKLRTKKEKCKKSDSLYLKPASHIAWFLTHKAKMLSKGVFSMIQNIRQVRAVSVQEALDAVDNGGFFHGTRRRQEQLTQNQREMSDAAAVALLTHQFRQLNQQEEATAVTE